MVDKPPDPPPSAPTVEGEKREERRPACPVCGGRLVERRAKLVCSRCHTICETCCEGGPG